PDAVPRSGGLQTDPPPGKGAVPLRVVRAIEQDPLVARRADPGARAHLTFQLTGAPACVSEGEDGPARPGSGREGAEDIRLASEGQPRPNVERAGRRVVVGV